MDALEMLKTRRSCRQFAQRMLAEDALEEILACGLNAPSAMNRQDTKILVLQTPETVQMFSKMNAQIMGQEMDPFYGASTVCLVVAPETNANADRDGALVIGAMQDGAFALGVGSCWVNRCDKMLATEAGKAWLQARGLDGYVGVGCCILGYPTQKPAAKEIRPGRIVRL